MKPDHKLLLEQCDAAYIEYLRTLNCCRQMEVGYIPVTDFDENKDRFLKSSRLMPVDG